MAKCEHCGFPHAIPAYCSNCGSGDPLPTRRLLGLAAVVFAIIILLALASVPIRLYFSRAETTRHYPVAPPIHTPEPIR